MGFPRQEYWKQQGIFLTQGSKRHLLYLLYFQMNSLPLSHLGSYSPGIGYFEYPQVIFFSPGDFNVQPKLGTSGLKRQRVAHQTFRTGRVCVLCARWRMFMQVVDSGQFSVTVASSQISRWWGWRPAFLSASNSWRPLIFTKNNSAIVTDHRPEEKGRRELPPSVSLIFVCMNPVESLLKHSMLGPTPEILIQLVQGRVHFRILSQVMQLMPVRG